MGVIEYIKRKLTRRKARRVFGNYPTVVNEYDLSREGKVQFANWENHAIAKK